ncbi:MAG: dihydroorotase [Planctomycetes bacterium]|nr:dihydroorotase [Planctomycetota bacterium]MCW8136604.1 dihydroorotase [Planctomycetota bacterium]
MTALVFSGAQVFHNGRFQSLEVRCDGPYISAVAPHVDATGARVIDAAGLHLFPGIIDVQVHFRDPGLTHKEDLETASRACAKGGVTSFLEMPNTLPLATTPREVDNKLAIAARKSRVNYGFFIGATNDNVSQLQMARRVCGIKVFMGASTGDLLVDNPKSLEEIFQFTDKRRVIALHAEDEAYLKSTKAQYSGTDTLLAYTQWRNDEAAWRATETAVKLAHKYQHRAHILHVSTARECALFRRDDPYVTAETSPHHLLMNVQDDAHLGTLAKMNPPLKYRADNAGLWQALHDGRIACIATDHAPHLLTEKRKPMWQAPAGIPAIENSLAMILDASSRGLCTLQQVALWMCENPAKVYRIRGRGIIQPGAFADLALVDANARHTIANAEQLTKCGWSPWDGRTVTGKAVLTVCNGQIVYEDGKVNDAVRGRELAFE